MAADEQAGTGETAPVPGSGAGRDQDGGSAPAPAKASWVRAIGPRLDLAARALRRALAVARIVLTSLTVVLGLLGAIATGVALAAGWLTPWLGLVLFGAWLAVACYAMRRVARMERALASASAFEEQFYAALDLTGAAAKAAELFGPGAPAGEAGAGRARLGAKGWARLLARFYAVVTIPASTAERVRQLPLIAPFLPQALAWTRVWLIIALAATVLCPMLAITLSAIGL